MMAEKFGSILPADLTSLERALRLISGETVENPEVKDEWWLVDKDIGMAIMAKRGNNFLCVYSKKELSDRQVEIIKETTGMKAKGNHYLGNDMYRKVFRLTSKDVFIEGRNKYARKLLYE